MPRSGVAVPRGMTSHRERPASVGSEREAFVSGSFGPDESVFERFGHGELASERCDGESYRVEVDRYWRRTAARRAAAEGRRADQFARADRVVTRAAGADGSEGRPDRTAKRAERSAARAERSAAPNPPEPPALGAENGDPYRELLQAWARETAQEPLAPSRRTVTITGHGAEGYTTRNGTRPSGAERYRQLPRHERSGFQPDRVAMWAVLLGMMMVLAAAATAHAAVVAHHVLALH
jgi:hypothetical protein